jgi:hypothetical protein
VRLSNRRIKKESGLRSCTRPGRRRKKTRECVASISLYTKLQRSRYVTLSWKTANDVRSTASIFRSIMNMDSKNLGLESAAAGNNHAPRPPNAAYLFMRRPKSLCQATGGHSQASFGLGLPSRDDPPILMTTLKRLIISGGWRIFRATSIHPFRLWRGPLHF